MSLDTLEPPTPSWEECVDLLARLPALPADSRIEALERLVRNPSPGIREQALRIGANVLPDGRLADYLRADADAVLRNAGSEIFRLRGGRSLPMVISLLHDADPDVVLQAVLILDRLRDPRALEPLHGVLTHPDPNVQQEAILAIGRLGDARSIPHLLPYLDSETWVQMAAVQALGDLRAPEAVPHLEALLADAVLSSIAAESLARIGGPEAAATLSRAWLDDRLLDVEDETAVGLLAHVLEGLASGGREVERRDELIAVLGTRMQGESSELRSAAARCLLVLGPSSWDMAALESFSSSLPPTAGLPAALTFRGDLIGRLFEFPGEARVWGLLLGARYPGQIPLLGLVSVVRDASGEKDLLAPLARVLDKVQMPGLGVTLLDLYLSLRPEQRELLDPVLVHHGPELREALRQRPEVDSVERLVLTLLTGRPHEEVFALLVELPVSQRPDAISRLMDEEALIRHLPWREWIAETPELFAALAAEAASRYGLHELTPSLRERAAHAPSPPLLRTLGDLEDREAVPLLLNLISSSSDLRLVAIESLGKIGGAAARAGLRLACGPGASIPEARVAFRALASCAEAEDTELFRRAASHPDWYVRLAVVDALARFDRTTNLAALTRLAADPVAAVAHRALAVLED